MVKELRFTFSWSDFFFNLSVIQHSGFLSSLIVTYKPLTTEVQVTRANLFISYYKAIQMFANSYWERQVSCTLIW